MYPGELNRLTELWSLRAYICLSGADKIQGFFVALKLLLLSACDWNESQRFIPN